jgi:hypothetical protein
MALTERGKKVVSGEIPSPPFSGETAPPQFKYTLSPVEKDFIWATCHELLFAWRDSPEHRPALERVMGNIGMEQRDIGTFNEAWWWTRAHLEMMVGYSSMEGRIKL